MKTVYSLDEAQKWFLGNSLGSIMCDNNGDERVCSSYPQAESFYSESRERTQSSEDDSSSIASLGMGLAMMESFDTTPSTSDNPDTSSSFDSGGGDFGGGGGGSDW